MRIFPGVLLLLHALVVYRVVSGAAVDRYESDRQRHTLIINLLGATRNQKVEESPRSGAPTTVEYGNKDQDEEYNKEYDYDAEYDDGLSGEYELELPRVAMSSKPKDPSSVLEDKPTEGQKKRIGAKRGKGMGKKRNPCLRKYKDYCIHGTCHYLRDIRAPSCVCQPEYHGERCELFLLPSQTKKGYNSSTALAVVAVVLSCVCLTIIGLLLALRFHKRGAYDVKSEEKVKLGLAPSH